MRPSPAQIERVARTLVQRLVAAQVLGLAAPEERIQARFTQILTQNFEQEAEIERDATTEAARLVRQGAPGIRRDELDLRRVEQLVKQRLAKARGFVL
jgi:hypothetical protein